MSDSYSSDSLILFINYPAAPHRPIFVLKWQKGGVEEEENEKKVSEELLFDDEED